MAPNPVDDKANIIIESFSSTQYTLYMTDINGLLRASESGIINAGKNEISLNTNNLTPNIYFIKIILDDKVEVIKIIKR